ncbi:MAG: DNA mismatch repair endonuclease MutL [Alphaproteobacteria bacterium]|nr:DNA mismatch repair endonuclease MutL [Alphaproteobacteria bacterium]
MIVRVLPEQVVNQIAAGEVVERPASVVKELVENAVDAGATRIEVLLKGGGTERIRVSDDGRGMDREDAMMCLERHATSKIRATDDLETVASLGFRGEAIPSIASVSRFSVLTRPHDMDEGVRVVVEGGEVKSARGAGCAPGTEIDVRDLFFNLPARRKFLRSRATEQAHCLEAVVRQALVCPDVAFRVTHDGRVGLTCDPTDLTGRTRQVLGKDANGMVDVGFERDGLTVSGRVSPLSVHRPSGKALYLFVNGRYVRDAVVRRAIQDAYRDRVPRGRTPLVVLDIRMDPRRVDVNVHPAKTEVRFRDPRDVQAVLSEGLRTALDRAGLQRTLSAPSPNRRARWEDEVAPSLPLKPAEPSIPAHPDDDPVLALVPRTVSTVVEVEPVVPPIPEPPPVEPPAPTPQPVPEEPEVAADLPIPTDSARMLRPIGPFGARWFLLEGDGELVVVDHVLGDTRLAAVRLRRDGRAQRLVVPSRQRLSEKDVAAVLGLAAELGSLGLEVVQMSPTELAVRTVPAVLPRLHLDGLLAKLAGAGDLAEALAAAQTPPASPDTRAIRALLLSLEEAGLDCVVKRVPASELTR